MDPGALGTLIIGLRAVDAELELERSAPEPEPQPERPRRHLRGMLATALRAVADRLEPASREPQTAP